MTTVRDLAKMIDHSILHPTMTDGDLERECSVAMKYDVASVCVKPYAVARAAELLDGSDVRVGTVVGFPAGNSTIETKVHEATEACRSGAAEVDMVVNIGKALQGDWDYIAREVDAVCKACHDHDAVLKVIFETDFVSRSEDIVRLSEICTEIGADYVKTSTGYGFLKGDDGKYSYEGATLSVLELMASSIGPDVKLKAAGGVRTLDDLLAVREAGCSRSGATATAAMLDEAAERFGGEAASSPPTPPPSA